MVLLMINMIMIVMTVMITIMMIALKLFDGDQAHAQSLATPAVEGKRQQRAAGR